MDKYFLKNSELFVEVNSFGAELCRIKDEKTNVDFLWNADEKFWKRHAPILFPFVGSLKNKEYVYDEIKYPMDQHGFARDMDFSLKSKSNDELWFSLKANDETLKKYPFDFTLEIGYRLQNRTISVMWKVVNNDTKEMYFSIGGHPAFLCPLNKESKQTDYYIGTDCKNDIVYNRITDGGLKEDGWQNVLAVKDGIFKITEHLFDQDALIVEGDQIHSLSLLKPDKSPYVTLNFNMPLCGIWSPAKKSAPFICLEPWDGRCDSNSFDGTLNNREYGHSLQPGQIYTNRYDIIIGQ